MVYLRRTLSEEKYLEKKPLLEHFVTMEKLFSQLKDAGNELSNEEKINYVLLSMPRSYENVITVLETMGELKLDFVKNRLLSEEQKRKKSQTENVESSFLCYTCGKKGHKQYECTTQKNTEYRKAHRQEYEQNFNQRRGFNPGRGYNQGRCSNRSRSFNHSRTSSRARNDSRGNQKPRFHQQKTGSC